MGEVKKWGTRGLRGCLVMGIRKKWWGGLSYLRAVLTVRLEIPWVVGLGDQLRVGVGEKLLKKGRCELNAD